MDPVTSNGHTIAKIICGAKNSCADRQKIFAYLGCVPKKKSKAKQGQYAAIGAAIRKARKAKGLSQADMGSRLDITRQGYAHYELGGALPPAAELSKLCEILDLDAGMFGKVNSQPVVKFPPTDDPWLLYFHRLWSALDRDDRVMVIESAKGRLALRGIPLDQFNQPNTDIPGNAANGG